MGVSRLQGFVDKSVPSPTLPPRSVDSKLTEHGGFVDGGKSHFMRKNTFF